MTTQTPDLYDAAMEEIKPTKHYFGEVVTTDLAAWVFPKGGSKRLFDPTVDPVKNRRLEITIEIQPLTGQYTVNRNPFDFTDDWQKFTLPSLKKLGLDLRSLKGKFVHVVAEVSGNYVNASGETKDRTALVFVETYADRTACEDAAAAFFGGDDEPAPVAQAVPAPSTPEVQVDKSALLPFLELTWKASGHDQEKFLAAIAATPMLSAVFNAQSPEVAGYLDDLPF